MEHIFVKFPGVYSSENHLNKNEGFPCSLSTWDRRSSCWTTGWLIEIRYWIVICPNILVGRIPHHNKPARVFDTARNEQLEVEGL